MSELNKAVVKAQSEFPPIDLNATVEVRKDGRLLYTFDYATLGHIKELTDPILHKNGLAVIHLRDGNMLVSQLIHEDGEVKESKTTLRINERASQQEEGSVVSYQKRYNHSGLLGIVAEKDDDANIADGNEAKHKNKTPKPPPSKFDVECKDAAKVLGVETCKEIIGGCGFASRSEVTAEKDQKAVVKALHAAVKIAKEMA